MGIINTAKLDRFLQKLKLNFAKQVMESQPDMIYDATSSDGVNYTATVAGVTSLYSGLKIVVRFSRNSSTTTPKLNVNNLGAKFIRQPLTLNNAATAPGNIATWLSSTCPVVLTYNGTMWKVDFQRTDTANLYGNVPIANGGTGASTAEAALTNLGAASKAYIDEQIAELRALIQ